MTSRSFWGFPTCLSLSAQLLDIHFLLAKPMSSSPVKFSRSCFFFFKTTVCVQFQFQSSPCWLRLFTYNIPLLPALLWWWPIARSPFLFLYFPLFTFPLILSSYLTIFWTPISPAGIWCWFHARGFQFLCWNTISCGSCLGAVPFRCCEVIVELSKASCKKRVLSKWN